MATAIPVVLFAYKRPEHLGRVLECLRREAVPEIIAFIDGPKSEEDRPAVARVAALLRAVDWTKITVHAAGENRGLGRSILAGVTAVAAEHDSFIVFEDDLVCVPGTYAWLCGALAAYGDDSRVMSITAWTHPRITPPGLGEDPYFDARAECWVWGTWARAWRGMEHETASAKLRAAERRGVGAADYGGDLPGMADNEQKQNIWAVRWLYHHLQRGGLCVRPARSLVEHIGFDASATNFSVEAGWSNPDFGQSAAVLPAAWPEPREHPACAGLWRRANPRRGSWRWFWRRLRARLGG